MITVLLCAGSLNLTDIVLAQSGWFCNWFWLPLLADVRDLLHLGAGRDQPRAVRPAGRRKPSWSPGFFVEYSSMTFALFFLGEYANMILMSRA